MGWAEAEFQGIDVGDKRLDRRAVQLMERLSERPAASIPGACNGWAEAQAAYRFLGNDGYDWLDICRIANAPRRAWRSIRWCCACRTRPNWTSTVRRSRGLAR